MPVDAGQFPRPNSPAALDDKINRNDKNYRRYASAVERALSLFDSALQEWADYISFLGRLLKALQTRPSGINDIPHTVVVAKRLAQCLDPILPSGVHQKALEVYSCVFSILGKQGLSRDLNLYLPGLSPTLSFASLSVKPALLSLFENFVVPLEPTILQPALKAIVLALLPGLEEETTDEFERTHSLLNELRIAVGHHRAGVSFEVADDRYFWQSLFLATITSSSRRLGGLAYLARNLPHLGTSSDSQSSSEIQNNGERNGFKIQLSPEIEAVISPEPGLLVRCFAAGLQDDQLLVQRGFLDLLATHIPLSSSVLHQRVSDEDLQLLISAGASVVARREMSLNKRLWAWFLGPGATRNPEDNVPGSPDSTGFRTMDTPQKSRSGSQTEYFERYGLGPLSKSLQKMVASESHAPASKARPFRICLSLMDRWEIGSLVVPQIFVPLMEGIWRYKSVSPSQEGFSEVLRSARVFFDGIQSSLIWGTLIRMMISALQTTPSNVDVVDVEGAQTSLDLVLFIVSNFNVREEEMLVLHMPMAALATVLCVHIQLETNPGRLKSGATGLFQAALKIATHLLDIVPERAFFESFSQQASCAEEPHLERTVQQSQHILSSIENFYSELDRNSQRATSPMSAQHISGLLMSSAVALFTQELNSREYNRYSFEAALSLFDRLIRKSPRRDTLDTDGLLLSLSQATNTIAPDAEIIAEFSFIAGLVTAFESLSIVVPSDNWTSDPHVRHIATHLVMSIWQYLSPSRPGHSVEAVRCLWRIHFVSPDTQLVEGTVATLMLDEGTSNRTQGVTLEGARCFATLWTHSSSIFHSSVDRRFNTGRARQKSDRILDSDRYQPDMLARPLLILFDSLSDSTTYVFMFVVGWLESLSGVQIIINFLLRRLTKTSYLAQLRSDSTRTIDTKSAVGSDAINDVEECLYYLRKLSDVISYCSSTSWASLALHFDQIVTELVAHDSSLGIDSAKNDSRSQDSVLTNQVYLKQICLRILGDRGSRSELSDSADQLSALRRAAVQLLRQLLLGPAASALIDRVLEASLIETLSWSIDQSDFLLQVPLMDLIALVLKIRKPKEDRSLGPQRRSTSRVSQISEKDEKVQPLAERSSTNVALLDCLILGLSSPKARPILEHWVRFVDECLPFYDGHTFQALIPLVDCFVKSIESVFGVLRAPFENVSASPACGIEPIQTLNVLFNGLEQALARGHDQLRQDEVNTMPSKSPEQVQGFFGNMVSGVFAPETQEHRSATANDRLTVLLCFKDAVKIAFKMWSWGDSESETISKDPTATASFSYTSIRLKNRSRRVLEHLFAAEALECLETLVEFRYQAGAPDQSVLSSTIFNLLHALEASRPKNTIPAIFNAIYSRTNPSVLDPVRKSTMTSELSDVKLAAFLVAYTRSMDDDALDEIWTDCMTFSKDVLGNPLPQRQTLPLLLEFIAILGEKIDRTNFGEQRRMRRDIGDLFVRLLAATFTIKPLAFSQDPAMSVGSEKSNREHFESNATRMNIAPDDIVATIASILPNMARILIDTDRIVAATNTISTQILAPTFRWKTFPNNVTSGTLEILQVLSKIPEVSKIWKKDVAEAFHDTRFFCASSFALSKNGWMPVMRQWTLLDKDRMSELLSRLTSPSSAGLMFGVGASSARLEADRKAQLNLRKTAFLILSADDDAFVVNLSGIQEKLIEVMNATAASSPSSITRAEVYMLLRGLVLKTSAVHLSPIWPIMNAELYDVLSSLKRSQGVDRPNITCVLQAAKLLDILITLAPDDFQLREWLYITDTIDAVYRPSDWKPVALVDELAALLDSEAGAVHGVTTQTIDVQNGMRKPLLRSDAIKDVPKEDLLDQVIRPFFRQLSINAFESTYQMETADRKACCHDLLHDLFDENTVV